MTRGNKSSSSSESDRDDDDKPSYEKLVEKVQFFNEICIKQREQISELKKKHTKTKVKNCDKATDKELIFVIDNQKTKLDSSQNGHENLHIKMKTLEEQNIELASKLEAIGSTPEAPKIEEQIKITKKNASTSCNDLFKLNSPLCDKVRFDNVFVETCT